MNKLFSKYLLKNIQVEQTEKYTTYRILKHIKYRKEQKVAKCIKNQRETKKKIYQTKIRLV